MLLYSMVNQIKRLSIFFILILIFVAINYFDAGVAKLVDAPDLGSGAFGRVGSSPITRTIIMILFDLKH